MPQPAANEHGRENCCLEQLRVTEIENTENVEALGQEPANRLPLRVYRKRLEVMMPSTPPSRSNPVVATMNAW